MTEPRFTEEEAAEIFRRAAEAQATPGRTAIAPRGMTLADLQEIGSEVGLPPALVAQAARSLPRAAPAPERTFLGLPVGVGRTVEAPRPLTDDEWNQLVVELRETFDARGTVQSGGAFRQWTNGNLQALLEPTPGGGQRLRLRTLNATALSLMWGGGGLLLVAAAAAVAALVSAAGGGSLAAKLPGLVFLVAAGAGMFGAGALRLPAWARRRQQQMDAVAERFALTAGPEPPESAP
jgi:hypothetical protein